MAIIQAITSAIPPLESEIKLTILLARAATKKPPNAPVIILPVIFTL
jgi:hypothetical protein